MHSSDFCTIFRNITRKYILSFDYFSAKGPPEPNPVNDDYYDFDSVTCSTFKVIPCAHTASPGFTCARCIHPLWCLHLHACAAFTHFSVFIRVRALPRHTLAPSFCVRALNAPISASSFSCDRCHSGAFQRPGVIRVRAASIHSGVAVS